MKPRFFRAPGLVPGAASALIVMITLAGGGLHAANLYWDTNGATDGSANATNLIWGINDVWNANVAGTDPTGAYASGSDVFFSAGTNATGANTVLINGMQTANSLTFEEGTVTLSASNAGGTVVNGAGGLTLGAGGITMNEGLAGTVLFGGSLGDIVLGSSQTWTNNTTLAPRALTLGSSANPGGIIGTATTGNTQTLTVTGVNSTAAATTTLFSVIGNGAGGGTLGLTKTGASILTLSGANANTYTGLTTLSAGSLNLSKSDNITAVAGDITVNGGTLTWVNANQVADTSNLSVSNGSVNFAAKAETIASLAIAGGSVSTGTGSGGVTVTGATSVGNATGATRLTVNSGNSFTTNSLTLTGGTFALGGSTGGNILLGGNGTVISSLNIGSGGLSMSGQVIQFNQTNSGSAGSQMVLNGNFTGSGTNTIGYGTAVATLASSVNLGATSKTFTLTGTTTIGVAVVGAGAGIDKAGTGTLVLSGPNTYTGITNVNAGILNIRSNTALGTTAGGTVVAGGAAVSMQGGITVTGESLSITGTGSGSANNAGLVNVSGDNVWAGSIGLDVSTQNARLSMTAGTLLVSGPVTLSAAGSGLGLVLTGAGGTGTISGVISGSGANQNLIKNGGSTWVLSGTNTYTGITRIDGGILSVGSIANNLGTSAAAINLGEGTTTGTLLYTGTGETTSRGILLRSVDTITAGGGVIDQSGSGLLRINGNVTSNATVLAKSLTLQGSTAGTGEIAGIIANSSSGLTNLVKEGTGLWTLSGVNTYTGTTTVNGGTLIAGVSTVVTSGINTSSGVVVNAGGTFALGRSDVIGNLATMTLNGGTWATQGLSETLGGVVLSADSTLALGDGGSIIHMATLTLNGTLAITGWTGLETGGGTDQVFVDSLTADTSRIVFVNPNGNVGTFGSTILGTGEIVALIPEPSVFGLALVAGAGFVLRRRRVV